MKSIFTLVTLLLLAYLMILAGMFLFQRSLLYFPVPYQPGVNRNEVSFNNEGITLQGWVLNPGQSKVLLYFGGNAEAIENNIGQFETIFKDYSVFLVHYRGYGKSEGNPTEAGLFSDAIAIYDTIQPDFESIALMGRSLGSGVAVYLASKRKTEKLILVTPFDSIVEVAQTHYPFLPVRHVARDRFESFLYAPEITAAVLMITAENDRIIPAERALKLREFFSRTKPSYHIIKSATHNDIARFPEYRRLLSDFINPSNSKTNQ